MSTKKEAAPVDQGDQTESGERQIVFDGFETLSGSDYITAFVPRQGSIAAILLRGRDNAMTTSELSRITGQHPRKITEQIQRERLHGAPIMSDVIGFWIAESAAEVNRCAAALHARAGEIHKTARALEHIAGGLQHG